ncbi:MAG: BatA domain-containing protein [Acidobacteria bacterium]|nr:BatA domain-containing protein [Acidobacteriota bacterium]
MGLLTPWFLAGLAAIALPIYLHLLRQHNVVPLKFSSLMFFERRTHSSVKRRRLRHLLLLALRILLLALVALAFANPFVRRAPAPAGAGGKLVVAAIDRSFSMRAGGRLERAKGEALAVLNRRRQSDLGQVLAFGATVQLLTQAVGDAAELRAAVETIEPDDSRSAYAELARALRALAQSSKLPLEVHLFSDMQRSSLPPSFADLQLAANLTLVPHSLATASTPNWTVESVTAPYRLYDAAKSRVEATVAGFTTPAARRTVTLAVNGRSLAAKTVDVPASGRARVEFLGFDAPHGFSRCEVRIDGADTLREDDAYLFSAERADPRRLLFVHEQRQARSLLYVRSALEAAREASFLIEAVSPEQTAGLALSKYNVVLLSDAARLPESFETALRGWVRSGGSVFVAAGPAIAARRTLPVSGAAVSELRYAAREGARFRGVASADTAHPALRRAGRLEGVRFYQASRIEPGQARVLARLDDQSPILLEQKLGAGKLLVFGSTLDNLSNDLPLHASFVPFIEQAASYLAGEEARPPGVTAGSFFELRPEGGAGVAAEVLDPGGRRVLSFSEAATARGLTLASPGYYDIRRAGGRRELVAVNPDRRESDLETIPAETLALWENTGQGGTAAGAAPESKPWALGWYILLGALGAAIAQSLFGLRYLAGEEAP